ncbi:MAG: hypothetical protein KAU17_07030 [Spirochaetales bacterium]|nr:hypothetical protein [Spirochaetales bacterium]
MFSRRKEPEEMESFTLSAPLPLPVLLRDSGMVSSASEARRLIISGAVKIEGQKMLDVDAVVAPAEVPFILSVGRRKFRRIL